MEIQMGGSRALWERCQQTQSGLSCLMLPTTGFERSMLHSIYRLKRAVLTLARPWIGRHSGAFWYHLDRWLCGPYACLVPLRLVPLRLRVHSCAAGPLRPGTPQPRPHPGQDIREPFGGIQCVNAPLQQTNGLGPMVRRTRAGCRRHSVPLTQAAETKGSR